MKNKIKFLLFTIICELFVFIALLFSSPMIFVQYYNVYYSNNSINSMVYSCKLDKDNKLLCPIDYFLNNLESEQTKVFLKPYDVLGKEGLCDLCQIDQNKIGSLSETYTPLYILNFSNTYCNIDNLGINCKVGNNIK